MPPIDNWLVFDSTSDKNLPPVNPNRWLDVIAANTESTDKPAEVQKRVELWKPDKIFLGIDVTSSMSEQPLAGMSQFSVNCAGNTESVTEGMKVDTRSKLDQLKDVLASFVSSLDDAAACEGRIFGLSVNPSSHDAFFDSSKKNAEQTGILFGDGKEVLSRKQIAERIGKLRPDGPATAVANAINECRIDAEKNGSKRPLLALWTDGQENCGGSVCAEIEKFAEEFPDGRIVVFGLDPTVKEQFDCVGLKAYGDRFKYVDARDPNKSLEVLGKMSNQEARGELVNKDVNGKLVEEELRGKALPFNPNIPTDGFYGEVFGELLRKRNK
ncbi:MAG: hypothetical protein K2Y22_13425 [Candidatus Obscuribacterales bacterium]|nr:hypothetical protein [Candidatus Obscuribacterales bacterium]